MLRTGLDSLNEVKYITLDYAVEAKYVRISVVQFSGSFACMRAELYKEGKWTSIKKYIHINLNLQRVKKPKMRGQIILETANFSLFSAVSD